MLIPIRCFTCGNLIGQLFKEWNERLQKGNEIPKDILDSLGLTRVCCRRMLITHVELLDETIKFSMSANKFAVLGND
jgi:DNA-directed RNA polymerase subunit N